MIALATKKDTARMCLMARLSDADKPLAVHELGIAGHSENALATEISIMAREKIVVGEYRKGKKFKQWKIGSKYAQTVSVPI